jgi:hypothetical protein
MIQVPENSNLARKVTRRIDDEPNAEEVKCDNTYKAKFILKEQSLKEDYETCLYLIDLDPYDFYARLKVCRVLLS